MHAAGRRRRRGCRHARLRHGRGGARARGTGTARPRARSARQPARRRRGARSRAARRRRAPGARHPRPRPDHRAADDRRHRRRRHDPAWARPARASDRRPQDRQDGARRRHRHQPAPLGCHLRLRDDRPEGLDGGAGHQGRARPRRNRALHFRRGGGEHAPRLAMACAVCGLHHGRVLPRQGPARAAHSRRPEQARDRLPRDLAALAQAPWPRGLSRRHLLHPLAAPGAGLEALGPAWRRLADGAADRGDSGRQPHRLYPDEPDLHHRRTDLLRAEAVLRGPEARRERGLERLARRRQDAGPDHHGGGEQLEARLRPVPRARGVHAVRRRCRRAHQGAHRARAPHPRLSSCSRNTARYRSARRPPFCSP